MSYKVSELVGIVTENIRVLCETDVFKDWFNDQKINDGDIVAINNSFIYRKPLIKTSKNNRYLCVQVENESLNLDSIFVVEPPDFNTDFKLFDARRDDFPALVPLEDALRTELEQLGQLVFILIGELENQSATVTVNHSDVGELKFDPSLNEKAVLQDLPNNRRIVIVSQLIDPDSVWRVIEGHFQNALSNNIASLKKSFEDSYEKLQNKARLNLILPDPNSPANSSSFLHSLCNSVAEEKQCYKDALDSCTGNEISDDQYLREIMRIAYNFADDAITILQLLVSITDLKGVLLWCTVNEHFDVAQAFRKLPWIRSHKKPSFDEYQDIIKSARNRAFHNFFAIDRTIEADLAGVQVNARRLTLFPAYRNRKSNVPFDYEDRELVEVLAALTRTTERIIPLDFWRKNLTVMESFEALLRKTEDALWAINKARQ